MAQVDVTINDQNYRIACEEGQQDHLRKLAGDVDGRIAELVSAIGQIGELRLLVMAAMLMADELDEIKETKASEPIARDSEADAALAGSMEILAERIETVAAQIERA